MREKNNYRAMRSATFLRQVTFELQVSRLIISIWSWSAQFFSPLRFASVSRISSLFVILRFKVNLTPFNGQVGE